MTFVSGKTESMVLNTTLFLLGPPYVKHFEVVFHYADLFLLVRLVEVLQYNGYVHVDDDHVADDDKAGEVRDGENRMSAVAVRKSRCFGFAIRRLYHQGFKHVVPSC